MMFEIAFEISPSGPFGVPEPGMTVLPGAPGKYTGDVYHMPTLTKVAYGALSQYRSLDQAIEESLDLCGAKGRLKDNFTFLNIDAEMYTSAYVLAASALDRFLQHLALSQQRSFSYRPLYIQSVDGKVYPTPKHIKLASVTQYDLQRLRRDIRDAQRLVVLTDERLDRSLQYFEHALFLYDRRNLITDFFSHHFRYLIAAVFLNLWKAVSTIIGDPSMDHDYQSRYKVFGFDHSFFQQKIERIRKLRNDYDVAHYHISEERIEEIEKNYGEAQAIAAEVLTRYREYVKNLPS